MAKEASSRELIEKYARIGKVRDTFALPVADIDGVLVEKALPQRRLRGGCSGKTGANSEPTPQHPNCSAAIGLSDFGSVVVCADRCPIREWRNEIRLPQGAHWVLDVGCWMLDVG